MPIRSKLERVAKAIENGTFAPETPLLDGRFRGPARAQMAASVDDFFAGVGEGEVPDRLRADIEDVLRTLYDGTPAPSGAGFQMGLEAVVVVDGSRPVFFFEQDQLRPGKGTGPFVDALVRSSSPIETAALAVGRIETDLKRPAPGADKWFEGTAFMVAPGLAMTNRHVVERMVNEPMSEGPFFTLKSTYWLNLGAQQGMPPRRFEIRDVAYAGPEPIGAGGDIGRLDLALLKIGEPEVANLAPPPILPLSARPPQTYDEVAVIGFPAAPPLYLGAGSPPTGYEIEQVLRDVFDSRFGFKRCASGEIDNMVGSYPEDRKRWAVKHDASTLGGNSGSPVLHLTDGQLAVAALHFAGEPRKANYAHAFSTLRQVLADHGVPLHT